MPRRLRGAGWSVMALALAAAGCALPGGVRGDLKVTAVFEDIGDLVVNHSVQTADVRIGSVSKIELTDDYRAVVTLSIRDVDLPRDSVAVLRTTSLLGEKFIEIRPNGDPTEGPFLADGDRIAEAIESPELEFVAEQAVEVLAGVTSTDIATLVETGAVGFGGREAELRGLLDDLSVISATLADQTGNIVRIIDGLGSTTATLAPASADVDQLLINLADATTVLADNRDETVEALRQLTRLASVQNETVFEPYLADVDRQVKQLDAILQIVADQRAEVSTLVDWLELFVARTPLAVPEDAAQIYGWFCPVIIQGCAP